jgi:hypothetical protein
MSLDLNALSLSRRMPVCSRKVRNMLGSSYSFPSLHDGVTDSGQFIPLFDEIGPSFDGGRLQASFADLIHKGSLFPSRE